MHPEERLVASAERQLASKALRGSRTRCGRIHSWLAGSALSLPAACGTRQSRDRASRPWRSTCPFPITARTICGLGRQPTTRGLGLCFSTLTAAVSSCSGSTWLALQQGEQWLQLRAGKLRHVHGHSSACRASHPPSDRLRHQSPHQTARERSSRRETSGSTARTRLCRKSRLPEQLRSGVANSCTPSRSTTSYSPAQLYSVIADVDSYQSFLPFTTASRVLNSTSLDPSGQRRDRPVTEKGWLRPGAGERWEMDAELRIGAMGFEEGYVSRVEAEKERWVKVNVPAYASCE